MCRHLGCLGADLSLQTALLDPPYSLARQSYAPRLQEHGVVNADGFGAGWYVAGRDEPVRYRRAQPIWSDASFASLAPTISSPCILAAVRSATPGFPVEESAAAPFTHGRWLFSHNGRLDDWPQARKALVDRTLDIPEAGAQVDSALLFGVAAAAWSAGAGLGDGLVDALRAVVPLGGGRLTMLAADGDALAGLAYGERLFLRDHGDRVVLASEPDDDGDWREVPQPSLVVVDARGIRATALDV